MTKLQKHLMQLVKEIDDTCDELALPYSLCLHTAGNAKKKDKFKNSCCEFHIMMFAGDAVRLKERLLAKKIPNRGFEDMSNNERLAGNHIRYVDTATTLIDRDNPVRYRMLGIAVTIHPLYPVSPSKKMKALELACIYGNGGTSYNPEELRKSVQYCIKASGILGMKKVTKALYHDTVRIGEHPVGESVYFRMDNGSLKKISSAAVRATRRINFEGMELPIPEKTDKYFKQQYGKDSWKKESAAPEVLANRIVVIEDAQKPYSESLREFKEAGIDIYAVQQEAYDLHQFRCKKVSNLEQLTEDKYMLAKRSVDRIDTYCMYQQHMDELRKAAEEKDMALLKELMEPYMACTNKWLTKFHMGFYVSSELFRYASMIWEAEGKKKQAQEIYDLTPEIYRNEDVGDFLEKYGIKIRNE